MLVKNAIKFVNPEIRAKIVNSEGQTLGYIDNGSGPQRFLQMKAKELIWEEKENLLCIIVEDQE